MVAKVYVSRIKAMTHIGLPESFQVRVKVSLERHEITGQFGGFDYIVGTFKTKEEAFTRKNAVILGFSDCFCTDEIEDTQ